MNRRSLSTVLASTLGTALVVIPASAAFAAAPTITSFTPASGPLGTAVVVTGTGFSGATTVELAGVAAHFTVKSSTRIRFTVPAAAGTGSITVTTPGGATTSAAAFAVEPGVTLTPSTAAPATTVSVQASGFSAFEGVDVFLDTTDLLLAPASRAGVVTTTLTVPSGTTPGTHWITAMGRHSGAAAQQILSVRTNWPMRGGRPSHTGANSTETLLDPSSVTGLDDAWQVQTGDVVQSSPAIADGIAYVGSEDGLCYAIDASTGVTKWAVSTGGAVDSSPAVSGTTVYVGSAAHDVVAFNTATGARRWTVTTGGAVTSSPVVVDGVVYVGSADGNVYALDAADGAVRWTFPTGGDVSSSPAVNAHDVFVGSGDGKVYAIDRVTGVQHWSFPTGAAIDSSPSVAAGTVYVGSNDDHLYALSAANGTQKWSFDAGDDVFAEPAVANGTVYVGSFTGSVFALDSASGKLRWSFAAPLGSVVISSALVANGAVYVGVDTQVVALNASNGRTLWDGNTGDFVGSSPAVVDGTVYVGSYSGAVHAWRLDGVGPTARPVPSTLHPAAVSR
jgi:outer membrane protein assembly factor BamB